jgi:endonuclease YncB( thermonuclease family)
MTDQRTKYGGLLGLGTGEIAALFAFAAPLQAQDFSCTVASITDGDTFRCTDGKKIRVHGIDAPEMDTRQGPATQIALADIIGGQVVVCEQNGTSYDRIVATCLLDGQDIAALMVQRAQARDCPRYSGGAYRGTGISSIARSADDMLIRGSARGAARSPWTPASPAG